MGNKARDWWNMLSEDDQIWSMMTYGFEKFDAKDIKLEQIEKIYKLEHPGFPEFWYESNACWGQITCMEDLQEKCRLQTDKSDCGIFDDKDEFLDRSKQNSSGIMDFGTRREHRGEKTLRQFLLEHDVDISTL